MSICDDSDIMLEAGAKDMDKMLFQLAEFAQSGPTDCPVSEQSDISKRMILYRIFLIIFFVIMNLCNYESVVLEAIRTVHSYCVQLLKVMTGPSETEHELMQLI